MLVQKRNLIADELAAGTGASIAIRDKKDGIRKGLRIWFNDLEEKRGPVVELKPYGLKSHSVRLYFGSFSARTIEQIAHAEEEVVQLARSLVRSITDSAEVSVKDQSIQDWLVDNGGFEVSAIYRHEEMPLNSDDAIIMTCREVVVPLMAAMAELIGYDTIEVPPTSGIPEIEGAWSRATVLRRERNPRNKLLCLRIQGKKCRVCGLDPKDSYGGAGNIIEVHHLEPISMLDEPRPYDPETDLVPLCPNCHRAVHTRRPWPLSLEELAEAMEMADGRQSKSSSFVRQPLAVAPGGLRTVESAC